MTKPWMRSESGQLIFVKDSCSESNEAIQIGCIAVKDPEIKVALADLIVAYLNGIENRTIPDGGLAIRIFNDGSWHPED